MINLPFSVSDLTDLRILPLLIACFLDWFIGDPWGFPHPVQAMGWAIAFGKNIILKNIKTPLGQKLAGIGLNLVLLVGVAAIGGIIVQVCYRLDRLLGIGIESILLASCFAGRSLRDAAIAALEPLEAGEIQQARAVLSLYVGRDTDNLESPDILRAVLETVSENCTDGVIAPLFYAAIGGVPLALAYKAASTLDSMIGYKREPYTHIGWFSAKLEDVLSWLPCRLTVIIVAILSMLMMRQNPLNIWRICQRDAPHDPSPNSGWSECVFAAALGVQLGGNNTYKGVTNVKPLLGDPNQPITVAVIHQALQLMRWSFLFLLCLVAVRSVACEWSVFSFQFSAFGFQ
ncbi:adenosylcobinamide-phosphate synthase CbiB [Tumidithrix helvetica PCC 7403]|uniref:adenosylcobinamide-phosphate synthase CbiB n=1 Tax=Tumidithrix helvetica TaxID=3457545 RepID=UPI003C82AA90